MKWLQNDDIGEEVGGELQQVWPEDETIKDLCLAMENDDLNKLKQQLATIESAPNLKLCMQLALFLAGNYNCQRIFDFIILQEDFNLRTSHFARTLLSELIASYTSCEVPALSNHFIRSLLDNGVDVNSFDKYGSTPLQMSCSVECEELIHLFLGYGANPKILSPEERLPFDHATSFCSIDTLNILFNYTYDEHLEQIDLDLYSLTELIRNNKIQFVNTTILQRVSTVKIPKKCPEMYINGLVRVLYKLPFGTFEKIVKKFSNIEENLYLLTDLIFDPLKYENTDVMLEYVNFFCKNCHYLTEFNCNLVFAHPKKISYDVVSQLFCMVLSYGLCLEIDLDQLYAVYGFSSLFETLLHMDINFVKCNNGPSFVPVWYNTVLSIDPHPQCATVFQDQKLYFSDKERVSSLLVLCRDATRKYIIQEYNVKNHIQYARVLQALPLCEYFKDLLTFKEKIYS